jgi:hypothetical protein
VHGQTGLFAVPVSGLVVSRQRRTHCLHSVWPVGRVTGSYRRLKQHGHSHRSSSFSLSSSIAAGSCSLADAADWIACRCLAGRGNNCKNWSNKSDNQSLGPLTCQCQPESMPNAHLFLQASPNAHLLLNGIAQCCTQLAQRL